MCIESDIYILPARRRGNEIKAANLEDLYGRIDLNIPRVVVQEDLPEGALALEKIGGIAWSDLLQDNTLPLEAHISIALQVLKEIRSTYQKTGILILDREPKNVMIITDPEALARGAHVRTAHIDLEYVFDDSIGGQRTGRTRKGRWFGIPFDDPVDEVVHNIASGVCRALAICDDNEEIATEFTNKWNMGDTTDPDHIHLSFVDLEEDLNYLISHTLQ